jgi:hypothetical protein
MAKIKLMEAIQGICWVKIPKANLYMLCCCPEGLVKHSM